MALVAFLCWSAVRDTNQTKRNTYALAVSTFARYSFTWYPYVTSSKAPRDLGTPFTTPSGRFPLSLRCRAVDGLSGSKFFAANYAQLAHDICNGLSFLTRVLSGPLEYKSASLAGDTGGGRTIVDACLPLISSSLSSTTSICCCKPPTATSNASTAAERETPMLVIEADDEVGRTRDRSIATNVGNTISLTSRSGYNVTMSSVSGCQHTVCSHRGASLVVEHLLL